MKKGAEKLPAFGSRNQGHGHTSYGYTSTYTPSVGSAYLTSPTGSTVGHHPLRLPGVRQRPASGLKLSIGAVPNMGTHPHMPTVPREKKQPLHLSNSDSKAIEALRQPSRSHHVRRSTTGDVMFQRRQCPAPPGPAPRRPHTQAAARQTLQPIANRPPSSLPLHPGELASKTLPPISSGTPTSEESSTEVKEDGGQAGGSDCSDGSTEIESSLESDEEIISEGASDAPPSRPGFESDAEKSTQTFSIPFPEVPAPSTTFPATIIQDHAQLDMERFAASAHVTGLSLRTDNIVRAFQIHGPLDRELLSRALNEVSSLHPLLTATFQRCKGKLYGKTSEVAAPVNLESPIVGHESSQDLIISARRKIFPLPLRTDLCTEQQSREGDNIATLSFVSIASCTSSQLPESPKPPPLSLKKKSVTFAPSQALDDRESPRPLLPELARSEPPPRLLMRARLVCKSPQEHILVLSFPRIICDFWSSCLFMQQLADVYGKLEKSASYRPSLAAVRIESKRQAVVKTCGRERGQLRSRDSPSRLLQKCGPMRQLMRSKFRFITTIPPQVHFHQVAQREYQLLKMVAKERLWAFWESMITATIRRQRGPNRVKVIPPVRIPSGLGERSLAARGRPQTSRLRPLTARNRPQTARRQQNSVFGELGTTREAVAGPHTLFHLIKVEEVVCESFRRTLPEECLTNIESEETLSLLCLGAFVLMLGRCCRGWGDEGRTDKERGGGERERRVGGRMERGRGDGASWSKLLEESSKMLGPVFPDVQKAKRYVQDPLQSYKLRGVQEPHTIVVPGSPQNTKAARKVAMGAQLDLGSFLIGVEVSLRDCEPKKTAGLFGPLTNDVGLRVNLSSSETFADLAVALGRSLQSARQHGHFPFATVAEELGLLNGLPIKFSFLRRRDITQLTNPSIFYFSETAVGVQGHGLARLGSTCYLTPLSTKMDDTCYLELLLWEGYDGECVVGGFRYQPQVIRSELVAAFGSELCWLLSAVAEDPCRSLPELAAQIHPPFLSKTRARAKRV